MDPSLERLITARAGIGGRDKTVEVLREVKIRGEDGWQEPDSLLDPDDALQQWISSSLVQTLLKHSRRGLAVEWTDGSIDVMAEARSKEIPRF
ncbi:hypothetical protein CYLTODRAFT_424481 [Cylindrobasidium torrendii FP15055 ss-10]|uniref:Uncharacterized protein n=1 Tax=Cylindrobasidium torrendii FP15055 ss-10 TaxID=1314674 RepID=A0A0D7B480_9AGAR|nr:hypothetical protein CYLTODRAFT_424481 [Cylindrobasidium torrendii FP15055 ss-10]